MNNSSIKIVKFKEEYAEILSEIIIRNLMEINSKDYSIEEMKEHSLKFSADNIRDYSKTRVIFVALKNDQPVGTLSIKKDQYGKEDDYVFLTIFVLPELHGKGVGKMLMEKGEEYIRSVKGKKINIPSSITAHNFYYRMGFSYIDNLKKPNSDGVIMMTKKMFYD